MSACCHCMSRAAGCLPRRPTPHMPGDAQALAGDTGGVGCRAGVLGGGREADGRDCLADQQVGGCAARGTAFGGPPCFVGRMPARHGPHGGREEGTPEHTAAAGCSMQPWAARMPLGRPARPLFPLSPRGWGTVPPMAVPASWPPRRSMSESTSFVMALLISLRINRTYERWRLACASFAGVVSSGAWCRPHAGLHSCLPPCCNAFQGDASSVVHPAICRATGRPLSAHKLVSGLGAGQ